MNIKNKNYLFFVLVVFILICLNVITKSFFDLNELIYNFYSEKLATEQINKIIENREKWQWIGYTAIPIIVLIRTTLVAMALSIGNFLYNINERTIPKFKSYFRIALIGEFVLLLVGYFKFAYFYFIKTDYTLQDLQQYYPLSYTNFLDLEKLQPWLIYPLQTVNLFEIAYFFVLVYGMYKLHEKKNYWRSFEITAVSYGTGLLIWLGLVMFLTLNMS